jgi:hypothetical protein
VRVASGQAVSLPRAAARMERLSAVAAHLAAPAALAALAAAAAAAASPEPTPFRVEVPDEVVEDINCRLERTRWPNGQVGPSRAKSDWHPSEGASKNRTQTPTNHRLFLSAPPSLGRQSDIALGGGRGLELRCEPRVHAGPVRALEGGLRLAGHGAAVEASHWPLSH